LFLRYQATRSGATFVDARFAGGEEFTIDNGVIIRPWENSHP
jgi:hypothetical protein